MDPHMDMDMDKDKDSSTPKAYQPRPHQQQPPQPQQGHRIASPQSHMHPQSVPSAHIMPPQQRPNYYGSPPGPAAPTPSATGHYRRPSSPGPYGNPPPSAYGSAPPATPYAPTYGRHPDYAKEDYRYSQQQQQQQPSDRRRDYESVEHSHEYAPISRDLYRSSSPTRHHHQQAREPGPVATITSNRRSAPTTTSASYAAHRGQSTPQTHSSIYQPPGPGHDQDILEREHGMRAAAHSPPLSRTGHPSYGNSAGTSRSYPARSPSPGPYGSSPPDNMSYRHYYEQQQQQQRQQQQQHQRAYRQEYYVSDGEGEGSSMGQHHPYQQQQPPHTSRAPAYRAWPAGSHEAAGREYPPSVSQQSPYYANSRQTVPSDRYESSGPAPIRPVSPYQSSYGRPPAHSVHAPTSAWTSTRSPEIPPLAGLNYRRRSASVDEGVDREKHYYSHSYHNPAAMRYNSSPYNRGMPPSYNEPTYISSRSPSPVRPTPHRSVERKAPAMSIAQLLSDKTSRDPSPEYMDEEPMGDRSRSVYRHPVQDHRHRDPSPGPMQRYRDRSPIREPSVPHRYNEAPPRGPGQLAERARMLPTHSPLESTASSSLYPPRADPRDRERSVADYTTEPAPSTMARPRDERRVDHPISHEDAQSTSTSSTRTEVWPEAERSDTPAISQEALEKAQQSPVQVKRRAKAEQDKRSAKAKTEETEGPVEEVKVKAKRGRKPKVKENPLETSAAATPSSVAPSPMISSRQEPSTKGAANSLKRRAPDTVADDKETVPLDIALVNERNGTSAVRPTSDSDEDFAQHKDLMSYMLEVHKRGQKVQRAYEKQTIRKRRKLHDKFLAKQEKRLEFKEPGDMLDDEGYLGTRAPSTETRESSQQPPPAPATKGPGKGRGRKRLQAAQNSEGGVKHEQDDDAITHETTAERKRRERKEAATAAAMAQVQAIKAKARARAQESEHTAQSEGMDEDHDNHVPRSDMYEDDSDDQAFAQDDQRVDLEVTDNERELEDESVMDEETLAKRQEKEYEAKRRAIWDLIAHRQIREVGKIVANSTSIKLQNCKKVAQLCQRESRKAAIRMVKPSREVHNRARKVSKEMLFFWKRNEKEERDLRKKAEKEAIEKLRIEEEMREARRQARKLNFLITQTELYSHFIGKKIGTEAAEADDDATPVRMQPSSDPTQMAIALDPNHTPMEGEPDFEEATDEALEAQAKWGAQQALLAAQERTKTFDAETKELQQAQTNIALNQADLDEMNFQNPSSMPTVTEIEQPKMLMCQLKGYQIKGLNWLANLYEQGINGILADEMGLGKTVQSISLMAHLAESQNIWGPFLVIAPASTLHNWQQEFTKFTPDLKALPYWGNPKDRKTLRTFWNKKQVYSKDAPFHVLITSYQLVVSDEKYFQRVKWQYMVLDEAQAIKSSSSARWKTLLGFNCRNRLLLTGTPIQNSMQELWALLHFIMPSLFDSHEEFSEWFSKDIESHAENKGTLNEHQLKRLHMILKPFMLRRIKKNVQNELGDKIELEVSCELTARQRALYRGLKEKISIAELLETASSLNSNDSVDSLMNLVMQFRKVCNHPELFERADVVSPLALCSFSQTPSIAREGDDLFVAYTTKSRISYSIPKRLYREGGLLKIPSEESNAGRDTKYLDKLFNIWTPDNIAESMYEENGAYSFLRFTDYSPSQASKVFKGHLLERFAQHLEIAEERSRRGYGLGHDESDSELPGSTYAKFLICETQDPFSIGNRSLLSHTQQLGSVLERSELGEYVSIMEPAYRPKVVAPPIDIICSDRSFLVDQQEQLFNQRLRQLLLGVSDFMTEASHQEEVAPIMDLWRVNNGRGLLGEPSISSKGYSTIEVPQMKQLVMDSGKLAVLDKLLVELKAGGHRVLVYFQMTKMIDLMEEYLTYRQYKYLRLDGSSKISDRRDMVTDWQTRPEIFIFLLSTRAGGLGINLTAADTVIFYDSDWNPTVDQQAMDRAHRLGQTRQVTVYRLITRGTIEERILQRAKQKDEIQKVVISGGEFKQSVDFKPREIVSLLLDDDELASKLQEQQLKRKIDEEEAKNSRKGGSGSKDGTQQRPSKRSKKDGKGDSTSVATPISTPSSSAAATPGKTRTLEEMWADMDAQAAAAAAAAAEAANTPNEGGSGSKSKRGRATKEKVPKEPKAKKEKEPKAKKPARLGKKAQAAADAAAAAVASTVASIGGESGIGEGGFGFGDDGDLDVDRMEM
ncbi:putative DNA helicase ino80 [Linnemannia hyalina]|uniref:Chromatin-remodeling ATPase INO80 n=1 Tax=Linnemannia hyalina TaxID=64524 RepID=A0A9P7XGA6_9FUNG|nr:putative DNA helicase ino80 [Linnemannia hyalina]